VSDNDNKQQIAETFLLGMRTHDWSVLRKLMTSDIVWTLPGHSRISGEARGIDAVIERSRIIVSYGLTFDLKHILFGFEGVALFLHSTATHEGKILDEHLATVCRLRGDRICTIDTYLSDPEMVNVFFVKAPTDMDQRADYTAPGAGMGRRAFGRSAIAVAAGASLSRSIPGQQRSGATNIVLVHGAFADGSSWSKVIPLLERKGFTVTAVQNPLTSLADDVATTRRLLEQQTQPTILVGHSYAGFVITEAGNVPNVTGLVYISSYGPAEGESHDDVVKRFAPPSGISAIRLDEEGFLWIQRAKFHEAFVHDVDPAQARILAAVQKPVAKKCFGTQVGIPAWKAKPSWFLVSTEDRLVNPDLERFMAKRMGATTVEVRSSHASPVAHPVQVADLIAKAANRG
jgi:pimeloyl-ACP methyl ester carboxylesterase/ketosteroid isomerase-like protein